ncbi:MAG: hypothetical protein HDT40_13310 [Lachnospiraceae bacterium]|nr:hypothetical protein [Lachnospiraceae bacterium]
MKKSLKKMFVAVLLVALICSSLSVFADEKNTDTPADTVNEITNNSTSLDGKDENIESGDNPQPSSEDTKDNTMTSSEESDPDQQGGQTGDDNQNKETNDVCPHSDLKYYEAKGTCVKEGTVEYWECQEENCKKIFSDKDGQHEIEGEIPTAKGNHPTALTKVEAKSGEDCTKQGTKEYYTCETCNETFTDATGKTKISAEEIAKGNYGNHPTALTKVEAKPGEDCTKQGTKEHYTCKTCSMKFSDEDGKTEISDEEIAKGAFGNHPAKLEKVDAVTGADCQTQGTKEYYMCKTCNKKFSNEDGKTEISDAEIKDGTHGSHKINLVPAKPGTCQEREIIEHYECTVNECGKIFADENGITQLDKVFISGEFGDHDLKLVPATNGTCVKPGTIEHYYCSVCERNFDTDKTTKLDSITGKLGTHNAIKIDAKEATETESGNIECWHCSECDKFFKDEALTKEIPAYDVIISATGDVDGPELPDVVDQTSPVFIDKGEDVPDIKLNDDAHANLITSAFTELEIASGKVLKVDIAISTVSAASVEQSELAAIKAVAKQRKIAVILDMNLVRKINGIASGNVHELDKAITITIDVPAAYISDNRKFSVIRLHDGIAEELPDEDNNPNTVTFTTGKFSLYALVYEDVKTVAKSADTGDNFPVTALPVVMLTTIVLLALCIKKMKKDNM